MEEAGPEITGEKEYDFIKSAILHDVLLHGYHDEGKES